MNVHDLTPDTQMSSTIGLLHAAVKYNYEKLKVMVADLSPGEIDYRGNSNSNSIAQLIRHLAVVDWHWVYRLQSKAVPSNLIDLKLYAQNYRRSHKIVAVCCFKAI